MKIIIAVKHFRKTLHRRYLTGFWISPGFSICQHSEYTGVPNIPGLWICQGSKYASWPWICQGVLDIPWFKICQGYTGFWKCLNNSWICLILPEYASICLNGFCFTFTYCDHLYKGGTIDCYLEEQIFDCFYSNWKYLILFFCFRLNIFTSKISNLLLPLGARDGESW